MENSFAVTLSTIDRTFMFQPNNLNILIYKWHSCCVQKKTAFCDAKDVNHHPQLCNIVFHISPIQPFVFHSIEKFHILHFVDVDVGVFVGYRFNFYELKLKFDLACFTLNLFFSNKFHSIGYIQQK